MTTVLNDRPNRSVENRQMEESWKIRTIDKQRLKDSDQKQKNKMGGAAGTRWKEEEDCTRRETGNNKALRCFFNLPALRASAEGHPPPHHHAKGRRATPSWFKSKCFVILTLVT